MPGIFGDDDPEINVRVSRRRQLTRDVVEFTLVGVDGAQLPACRPGAHIAVRTPSGAVRQYSLVGPGDEANSYLIAVKLEANSRGGSSSMIEQAAEGTSLVISQPRNEFALRPGGKTLFIAAGIGITPIYAMAKQAKAEGRELSLRYLARSPAEAPYLEELQQEFGEFLLPHFTHEGGSSRYDFWDDFVRPQDIQVYCCGPKSLIQDIRDVSGHWPEDRIHWEDFKPVEAVRADDKPFEIVLARSMKRLTVPADRSILETLRDNGLPTVSSCESGTCGTCKTGLVSGAVEHRDLVLREDERQRFIMTCVSRAAREELVLDI